MSRVCYCIDDVVLGCNIDNLDASMMDLVCRECVIVMIMRNRGVIAGK